jgi:glycosyltransferase involved in cell wall biosynthesis
MAVAKLEELTEPRSAPSAAKLPVTVILAVRNEEKNLPRCLSALRDVAEVYLVDSHSTDRTVEIARDHEAKVVQFHYRGGWPKKRQWALDSLHISNDWVLLLDADEVLTPALAAEIRSALRDSSVDGYFIQLRTRFLGRVLRHGGVGLWKLALFRRGTGRFECRLKDQDASMADMEIHEHVMVEGAVGKLRNPLIHENVESLSRYIQKHDEYSNWESRVLLHGARGEELPAALLGTQAQRRRWFKRHFFALPGSSLLLFLYRYIFRFGFLDGVPGLIYCSFQAIQMFHTKAKIYELRQKPIEHESSKLKSIHRGNYT